MNTRKGRAKFNSFQILLESGFNYTIVMGWLVEKLYHEKYSVTQWHTKDGNIATNLKVGVYFTLPALSATNIVTCRCHVDDSAKGRYDMMLGWYILTQLGLNLKFSEHVIESGDGTFKGSTTPIVDLGTYIFKDLNTSKSTPEEFFTGDYVKEVYKSENLLTATKKLHIILDAKYEKENLHKVMETQCQHLTMTQRNELLKLLQIFKELFNGTLFTWKTDPVDFELKIMWIQYSHDHTQYRR